MDAAIVHYNTPELTEALVRSIRKWSPSLRVTVFDNSDARPFPQTDGVTVIDNTRGQLVDFTAMLRSYPNKIPTACNWGSEKHIASVEWLFDALPDGFILLDSDVLLKRDITGFADPSVAWAGEIERRPKFWFQAVRLYPMLLWINVPMLRQHGIRFFHEGMVYKMSHEGVPFYDTGGSLLKDCRDAGLPGREIPIFEYIEHFGGGSYGRAEQAQGWLDEHKELYE